MTSIMSLAHRGKRNLSIVASCDPPTSADTLYARYCAAHARWNATKSEVDREVREAFEAFGVAFCGDAAFVAAEAARSWEGAA
jgi:hypothetical protein